MIHLVLSVAHCAPDPGATDPRTLLTEYPWSQRASRVAREVAAGPPYGLAARLLDTGSEYRTSSEALVAKINTIARLAADNGGVLLAVEIHFDSVLPGWRGGPTCGYWHAHPLGRQAAREVRVALSQLTEGHKRPLICYPDARYPRDRWCRELAERGVGTAPLLVEVGAVPPDSEWLAHPTQPERVGIAIGHTLGRLLSDYERGRVSGRPLEV